MTTFPIPLPLALKVTVFVVMNKTELGKLIKKISLIKLYISLLKKYPYLEFSGPHFPAFGLNTERYSVALHIQFEFGKIRTRKIPNTDTVNAVCFYHFS